MYVGAVLKCVHIYAVLKRVCARLKVCAVLIANVGAVLKRVCYVSVNVGYFCCFYYRRTVLFR